MGWLQPDAGRHARTAPTCFWIRIPLSPTAVTRAGPTQASGSSLTPKAYSFGNSEPQQDRTRAIDKTCPLSRPPKPRRGPATTCSITPSPIKAPGPQGLSLPPSKLSQAIGECHRATSVQEAEARSPPPNTRKAYLPSATSSAPRRLPDVARPAVSNAWGRWLWGDSQWPADLKGLPRLLQLRPARPRLSARAFKAKAAHCGWKAAWAAKRSAAVPELEGWCARVLAVGLRRSGELA